MKQDYLWDKTGEDREIEKLENALKAFRYQETAPPELPAKVIPFPTKSPRRFFRLSFAFAACAALVIVSLGVWFQFSNDAPEFVKDSPNDSMKITAPQPSDEFPQKIHSETRYVSTADANSAVAKTASSFRKNEVSKQSAERKVIKVKKIVPATSHIIKNTIVAQNPGVRKPEVKLTKDERYAYDQLMTALSITSSKLKLVKDKVENVEEQNAAFSNNR